MSELNDPPLNQSDRGLKPWRHITFLALLHKFPPPLNVERVALNEFSTVLCCWDTSSSQAFQVAISLSIRNSKIINTGFKPVLVWHTSLNKIRNDLVARAYLYKNWIENLLEVRKLVFENRNPAYGRQRTSWPMQIVAPIIRMA